jgi:hypothetical protein
MLFLKIKGEWKILLAERRIGCALTAGVISTLNHLLLITRKENIWVHPLLHSTDIFYPFYLEIKNYAGAYRYQNTEILNKKPIEQIFG